jgi:hypothetical protein
MGCQFLRDDKDFVSFCKPIRIFQSRDFKNRILWIEPPSLLPHKMSAADDKVTTYIS